MKILGLLSILAIGAIGLFIVLETVESLWRKSDDEWTNSNEKEGLEE